jgi:hypothetical protein
MLRSAGAVAAGILVLTVLAFGLEWAVLAGSGEKAGLTPHSMSTSVRIVVSILTLFSVAVGGYVTAWLAARRPVAHAITMGLIELAMTAALLASTSIEGPRWIAVGAMILLVPAAWFGGYARTTGTRGQANAGQPV